MPVYLRAPPLCVRKLQCLRGCRCRRTIRAAPLSPRHRFCLSSRRYCRAIAAKLMLPRQFRRAVVTAPFSRRRFRCLSPRRCCAVVAAPLWPSAPFLTRFCRRSVALLALHHWHCTVVVASLSPRRRAVVATPLSLRHYRRLSPRLCRRAVVAAPSLSPRRRAVVAAPLSPRRCRYAVVDANLSPHHCGCLSSRRYRRAVVTAPFSPHRCRQFDEQQAHVNLWGASLGLRFGVWGLGLYGLGHIRLFLRFI